MSTLEKTPHITVRSYQDGDEHYLVDLFQKTFGLPITVDHWRWKLKQQPSSVDNVWLAVSGGRPVFQYAGIPTRFLLSQTAVNAMVSVDTMTAPEFRRRGLLTQVARQAYESWRERGIAFVIGLPNEQWGSRIKALGWQELFALQWLVYPLRPEAMLARRLKMPLLRRATVASMMWNRLWTKRFKLDPEVQVDSVTYAGPGFNQIWESCKSDTLFSAVRNSAWVNWRFLNSPSRIYEVMLSSRAGRPTGYCAYRINKTGEKISAHLAEILTSSADRGSHDTLLRELVEKLLAVKAEMLMTLAVPGTQQFRWLRNVGFISGPKFSVQLVPLAPQLPLDEMRNPENWRLTGADFDVT